MYTSYSFYLVLDISSCLYMYFSNRKRIILFQSVWGVSLQKRGFVHTQPRKKASKYNKPFYQTAWHNLWDFFTECIVNLYVIILKKCIEKFRGHISRLQEGISRGRVLEYYSTFKYITYLLVKCPKRSFKNIFWYKLLPKCQKLPLIFVLKKSILTSERVS